jgi:S-DNA-T family DNA segregation ATPase FtsK/SpoIIIE
MKPIYRQFLLTLLPLSAVVAVPLLAGGCAQFNQLMGTPAEHTATVQPAPAQEPTPQTTATPPAAEPASPHGKVSTGPELKLESTPAVAPKSETSHEQPAQAASSVPSQPAQPADIAQPVAPESKAAADKAVAEKGQSPKVKKSTKKSSKPAKKSQPEDAFLPPVPLPSKPAAIGGSGG